MTARVLLVDDEDGFREDTATLLRQEGFTCDTAADGDEAIRYIDTEAPDIMICDLMMPRTSGIDVVRRVAQCCPETPVVVITAHATLETAVEAFRAGAVDYLLKPIIAEDLFQKISRLVVQKKHENELRYLRRQFSERATGTTIVGASKSIEAVRNLIARVGPSKSSVLITGESGTGKELVARALHAAGDNERAPFIAVNCAALPHELVESELFGHVRGAFTGAHRDKPGYFELASGGTIFLDEICELPIDLQPKLLRAIEHQEIYKVGGTRAVRPDVRIIVATNRNLDEEVAEGRFREDLYFRVSVVEIGLPPLRERRDDIPLLVDHFVMRLQQQLGRRITGVSNAAMRALMSAPWRGNIRELENILERMILLSDDEVIDLDDLPRELAGNGNGHETQSDDLRTAVRAYEREHIRHVLHATAWNREEASRRLGIDVSTLYRRMKELELEARA